MMLRFTPPPGRSLPRAASRGAKAIERRAGNDRDLEQAQVRRRLGEQRTQLVERPGLDQLRAMLARCRTSELGASPTADRRGSRRRGQAEEDEHGPIEPHHVFLVETADV